MSRRIQQIQRWLWRCTAALAFTVVAAYSMAPVEIHRWMGASGWWQISAQAWAQVQANVAQQIARSPARRIDDLPEGHFGSMVIALPDGKKQSLQTRKLHVRVSLQGKVARTEVEQVFYNATNRQTEGTFTFHLPDGAAIVRLAMDVNGKLVEGELVERTRARAIYSSIVRKMKDPALLEWQGGNRFRTQIFPIPARGTKKVILAYDHILEGSVGNVEYVYHLARAGGGPKIADFSLVMSIPGQAKVSVLPYDATIQHRPKQSKVSFKAKQFRSRGHFVVKVKHPKGKARGVLHAGKVAGKQYGMLALPLTFSGGSNAYRDRVLVVDTSAGVGDTELAKARIVAEILLRAVSSKGKLGLVVGDAAPRHFKPALVSATLWQQAISYLARQEPRGATDLQAMLLAGIKLARERSEVIYIGDGLPSLGEMDPSMLVDSIKKAIGTRQIRLSVVGMGSNPDMGLLRRIARETGGRAVRLQVGQQPKTLAQQLQRALSQPMLSEITYQVKGMSEILRAQKGVLASGETLMLSGQMTAPAIRVQVKGKINGKTPFSFKGVYEPAESSEARLAPAFWARWTIEKLQQQGVQKRRIIELSKAFGVMSRYTSFLVLENDKAYKKHQIARRKNKQRRGEIATQAPSGADKFAKKTEKKDRAGAIRQWMRPKRRPTRLAREQVARDSDDANADRGPSGGGSAPGGSIPSVQGIRAHGATAESARRSRRSARPADVPRPSAAQPSPPAAEPAPAQVPRKIAAFVAKPKVALQYKGSTRSQANTTTTTATPPKQIPTGDQLKRLRAAVKQQPMGWYPRYHLVNYLVGQRKWRDALKAVRDWRRYAREDASLIIREVKLLKKLGKEKESRRVLSELVEFSPNAYARRAMYASQLERLGNITAACQQYTQAVRLNPAVRDSFRTMMGLFRKRQSNKEYRDIVQECIVKGVSRLPVVRDISMVLFWDDPSADIDLHVHEPGGEEVSYRKRESRQGGTLYYDITNGLGPEIYVLGTGKKGTYKIDAVLYRGSPDVISATLVVLRNAGSPKETRKTYHIKLYKRDGRKPVSITSIRLK